MQFNQALPQTIVETDALTVNLMPERCRYSLRVKPADLSAFKKASKLELPARIGKSHMGKDMFIFCLGPDEWLIIAGTKAQAKLDKLFTRMTKKFGFSYTDISHRNVALIVMGSKASEAVNAGCPLDLSLGSFPVGKATRTVFENAPILLMRTGEDQFTIECWRSYGPYLRDFMTRIASAL